VPGIHFVEEAPEEGDDGVLGRKLGTLNEMFKLGASEEAEKHEKKAGRVGGS
jgi:hypothetical protein